MAKNQTKAATDNKAAAPKTETKATAAKEENTAAPKTEKLEDKPQETELIEKAEAKVEKNEEAEKEYLTYAGNRDSTPEAYKGLTAEEVEYSEAYQRYLTKFLRHPDPNLSANELDEAIIEAIKAEGEALENAKNLDKPQSLAENEGLKPSDKEEELIAKEGEVLIIDRRGKKALINKITWDLVKDSNRGHWKEVPEEPKELKELRDGKRN